MEEVREGPVEIAYRSTNDPNKTHEVWYWELIKAQMPDLARKLPDGKDLAVTEKKLNNLKGPEKEQVRDIQQSTLRRLVELEVQNKSEHADTFIREGPIKSAITQFALSTGYLTPKELKNLLDNTPLELKTLDRYQKTELRKDEAKSQSMLEPVFPALYALLDKMPVELLSVFAPAQELDKSKISIGELVTFNAIITPIQLKIQNSGLKEQDINTLTTVTQLLTGALKNEIKFHQEIESRVNRASEQKDDKSSLLHTNLSAKLDPQATQDAAIKEKAPDRKMFFGRFFEKASIAKSNEAPVRNQDNFAQDDFSFRDQLRSSPPLSQKSAEPPKFSDVEFQIERINTLSRFVKNGRLDGEKLVARVESVCRDIDSKIDFKKEDRYKADDMLVQLRNLVSDAGDKIPEGKKAVIEEKISALETKFEEASVHRPGN